MPPKSGLVVWTMYQSAKPPEVVQDAFLVTCQPPSTFLALEETGYQKWLPVSGSE